MPDIRVKSVMGTTMEGREVLKWYSGDHGVGMERVVRLSDQLRQRGYPAPETLAYGPVGEPLTGIIDLDHSGIGDRAVD